MKIRTAVAVATLVPLAAIGLVVVPQFAGERWAEMAAWATQAQQQWTQRDFRRAPAWGEARAGAAAAAYDDALAQAGVLGPGDARLLRELRQDAAAVAPAAAAAFAQRWSACLATLADGAHRDDARPHVQWQGGFRNDPVQLLNGRDLLAALAIEVRRRIAAGDGVGAVQWCLDGATFATDLERSPRLVDQLLAATLAGSAAEALADDDLRPLDDDALRALADGLQQLDGRCLQCVDGSGEALLLARTLLDRPAPVPGGGRGNPGPDAAPGLRYGWSRRWAEADAVLILAGACEQLDLSRTLPWPARRVQIERAVADLAACPNAIVRAVVPDWTGVELTLRRAATQVRLLRLAVACHRGAALPALDDPLGSGPLAVLAGDGAATFRSAGGSDEHPLQRTARR